MWTHSPNTSSSPDPSATDTLPIAAMSGIEVLGAIASAVQLATSCYQLQKRVRMRSGDRALTTTIHIECGILISDINNHILTLTTESRQAAQHLVDRLIAIKARIEKRQSRKSLVKGVTVLRLYGGSDKDDLMAALQEYQTRAALIGSVAVNAVLSQVNRDRITEDVQSSLLSITSGLTGLGYNMTQTENRLRSIITTIEAVDGKMDVTLSQLSEISCEVKRSNALFSDFKAERRDVMSEKRAVVREYRPVCGHLNPLGQLDRGDLEVDYGTMKGYLESIVQGGGWTSDLDIVECLWDVV